MESRSVAIDGPAGAGKSTLAKRAAKHFSLIYVDTGALYRCIGLHALRSGVGSRDVHAVVTLLPEIQIKMNYDEHEAQRMFLCGKDVMEDIRLPEVSAYASDVSAIPQVRDHLLYMQRDMAVKYDVIMDGRDIGTVVLPSAGLKIFLTADISTRAKRRYLELTEMGLKTSLNQVFEDMSIRDKNDTEREIAPLKIAGDACILDTTDMSFEQSFEVLCSMIAKRFDV